MRIGVSDRYRGIERQLALESQGGLHEIGSAHGGTDALNRAGCERAAETRDIGYGGEKIRVGDYVLLLHDAVIAPGGERIRKAEAIVEHPKSPRSTLFGLDLADSAPGAQATPMRGAKLRQSWILFWVLYRAPRLMVRAGRIFQSLPTKAPTSIWLPEITGMPALIVNWVAPPEPGSARQTRFAFERAVSAGNVRWSRYSPAPTDPRHRGPACCWRPTAAPTHRQT